MASPHIYDCFDISGKGHLYCVNELFEKGVWIGYLDEDSRNNKYRNLPSFRELEENHKKLFHPSPHPFLGSYAGGTHVVCRGCVRNESDILEICEIPFNSGNARPQEVPFDSKSILAMCLSGTDDTKMFCILLPQSQDRSIKALQTFRIYEHDLDRTNTKPFDNNYMLLAARDRQGAGDLLTTVRTTLKTEELLTIASRVGRQQTASGLSDEVVPQQITEAASRLQVPPQGGKRKQLHGLGESPESRNLARRTRPPESFQRSHRKRASMVQQSTLEKEESNPEPVRHASSPETQLQQETLVLPMDIPRVLTQPSLFENATPNAEDDDHSKSLFTDIQGLRVLMVWKLDFEGTESELVRTLRTTRTFQGVLDAFRSDTVGISSLSQQLDTDRWMVSYRLADGTRKVVILILTNPDSELSFDRLLRSLSEKDVWKDDPDVIVEIELRAMVGEQ